MTDFKKSEVIFGANSFIFQRVHDVHFLFHVRPFCSEKNLALFMFNRFRNKKNVCHSHFWINCEKIVP